MPILNNATTDMNIKSGNIMFEQKKDRDTMEDSLLLVFGAAALVFLVIKLIEFL
jgi:hypothetical protein